MFQVVFLFSCVLSVVCPPDTEQSLASQVKSLQRTVDLLRNDLLKVNDLERQLADLSAVRAKLNNLEQEMAAARVCRCGEDGPFDTNKATLPADCWGHKMRNSSATTGWYKIKSPLGKRKPLDVYCDMDTAGGGWTVFQRRIDGSADFNRSYAEYRIGFGNRAEFWLGNDLLHAMTLKYPQQLRVDLCDWDGNTVHATYQSFSVGPATDLFRLNAEGYRGNAGNALDRHGSQANNKYEFSAPGNDNDQSDGNCAKHYSSGWWFNKCFYGNLNGAYLRGPNKGTWQGIQWSLWRHTYSLKACEMKFRPASANPSSTRSFACPKSSSRISVDTIIVVSTNG